MTFRLLPRAIRDLESVLAWIEADDPAAAERIGRAFFDTFERLSHNPAMGRPTQARQTREWVMNGLPYLIPYRVKNDVVEILRVFHTRRRRPDDWS